MAFRIKPLMLVVVSVVILAALIWVGAQKPATNGISVPSGESRLTAPESPAAPATTSPSAGGPTPALTPTPPPKSKSRSAPASAPASIPSAPKTSATFIAPVSGAKWVFGENNIIQWSKEIGFAGELYLVNASDKSIAGWIITETGIHQTSYAWNTRDIYVSKTDPSKKTVATGDYLVKAVFNTNPKIEITSAPFSIIYESEVQIPVHNLTIQNYVFSAPSITVKKGDKLVFMNNDPVTHTLNLTSYSPFVIQPGASFTFDTSVLEPGPYNFYSPTYSAVKVAVTVQ